MAVKGNIMCLSLETPRCLQFSTHFRPKHYGGNVLKTFNRKSNKRRRKNQSETLACDPNSCIALVEVTKMCTKTNNATYESSIRNEV